MGRRSLFVLVCLVTAWIGNLEQSAATPLAVVAPKYLGLERVKRGDLAEEPIRKPEITKLQVKTAVTSRFSSTTVTSILRNRAEAAAAEAEFHITLPKEAFIANFSIEIDGVVYPARIETKEEAQRTYDEARKSGRTGAQVKQQSEKDNTFTVSVNVARKKAVTFELVYQEMLTRKKGYFEHRTSIRPGQIVKNLGMEVIITELQGLTEVNTSWVKDQENGNKITKHGVGDLRFNTRNTRAVITYAPTVEEQRQERKEGIQGDFVIRYDVAHPRNGGELQIVNGYFVHYFSPEGLPVVRKNVVFVIDTSGSMSGRKIKQTKEAIHTILSDLREIDYFNIVTFESDVDRWADTLRRANPANVRRAKAFVSGLAAGGMTNLHGALMEGVELLNELTENEGVSMMIMLTDGKPTAGTIHLDTISSDVEQAVNGKYSLFNLGFGDNVDYPFLEKLGLRNRGLARKIYDDSKASLQLKGFFDEVATPLLYNVVFNYPEELVETNSLTQTTFPNYFKGTELVVTGKIKSTNISNAVLQMTIAANSVDVPLEFPLRVETEPQEELINKHTVDDFAQRLWAYVSIKELLRRRSISNNETEKDVLKEQALQLSLEYHFVTPLTSLVVVKPDEEKPEYVEPKAQKDKSPRAGFRPSFIPSFKSPLRSGPAQGTAKSRRTGSAGALTRNFNPGPQYRSGGLHGPQYLLPASSSYVDPVPQRLLAIDPYPSYSAPTTQPRSNTINYRSDNRCGSGYLAPNGEDAKCPCKCCSGSHWCGTSDAHCLCNTCSDQRNLTCSTTSTSLPTTTLPSTTVPSTTVPSTTVPSTTIPSTAVPSTTLPPTTLPPSVGDTQFLVKIPRHNSLYVCFNITGHPGDTYRLIKDPTQGITVVGKLTEEPYTINHIYTKGPFLREVTFVIGSKRVVVMPHRVRFEGKNFAWQELHWWGDQYLSIRIQDEKLWVMIGTRITLVVIRHTYQTVYHLGVYIEDGRGFSNQIRGLIGQFQHNTVSLNTSSIHYKDSIFSGELNVESRQVPVVSIYANEPGLSRNRWRQCWYADDNGAGLIDGSYINYLE